MATRTAFLTQVNKNSVTFAGKSDSNHWITIDGPEQFGGSDAGIRAKELLLLALGGCTGSDVASILTKKRQNVEHFEMNITADQSEEMPKEYTAIHIEYVIYGTDLDPAAIERAIELSQTKYCGVTAMLEKAIKITHSYRIESSK